MQLICNISGLLKSYYRALDEMFGSFGKREQWHSSKHPHLCYTKGGHKCLEWYEGK